MCLMSVFNALGLWLLWSGHSRKLFIEISLEENRSCPDNGDEIRSQRWVEDYISMPTWGGGTLGDCSVVHTPRVPCKFSTGRALLCELVIGAF